MDFPRTADLSDMPEDLLTAVRPRRSLDDLLPRHTHSQQQAPLVDAPEKFVLMISGSPGDAQRYRCDNKIEEFEYLGLTSDSIVSEQADYDHVLGRYEMFLLHRVQNSPRLEQFIKRAKSLGKPVIFDTDDLIFDQRPGRLSPTTRYMAPRELRIHKDFVYRNCRTLEQCDSAIVSTERLRDSILELFPEKTVYLHRNAASRKFAEMAETVRDAYVRPPTDVIRIAYVSGSKTHKDDFAECVRPLRRLLQKYPQVRMMAVGHVEIPAEVRDLGSQVEAVPPVPWYHVPMCYAMVDINLAPLELNNMFTESKSELKYFEPALLEIPTAASDIAPFRVGIKHGETGFLCANDEEWFQALEQLVLDAELRVRMGKAAKADVLSRYTTKARSENLKQILEKIVPGRCSR
jgi:glycosyltransferase involved in cell wall biosynthesis